MLLRPLSHHPPKEERTRKRGKNTRYSWEPRITCIYSWIPLFFLSPFTHTLKCVSSYQHFVFSLSHCAWSHFHPPALFEMFCLISLLTDLSLLAPACPVTELSSSSRLKVGFLKMPLFWLTCFFLTLQDGIRKKRMELIEKERKQREQVSTVLSPYLKSVIVFPLSVVSVTCVISRCSCLKQNKWRDMKRKRWVQTDIIITRDILHLVLCSKRGKCLV